MKRLDALRSQSQPTSSTQLLAHQTHGVEYKYTPESSALYQGVRVLELASVVAAPLTATLMGIMGAEVVKIEEPKGDFWRRFFLDYEPGRTHSSAFETVNFSKASIVLDIKQENSRATLLKLLEETDVFITNVRVASLQKQGLDYESLKAKFPKLIYAHISAFGLSGPDKGLPGYDVGSWWALPGLSATVHKPGNFQIYPPSVGDSTTSLATLAGINIALRARQRTGMGQLVDSALLRVGLWTMCPYLVKFPNEPINQETFGTEIPDYNGVKAVGRDPLWTSYGCKDERYFTLLSRRCDRVIAQEGAEYDTLLALARVAGIALPTDASAEALRSGQSGEAFVQKLRDKFRELEYSEVKSRLDREKKLLSYIETQTLPEVLQKLRDPLSVYAHGNALISVPGVTDVPKFALPPFKCHGSGNAEFSYRPAPSLGVHTTSFLAKGWTARQPGPGVTAPEKQHEEVGGALEGVVVVELWDEVGACAASACAQLAQYGARVIHVEPPLHGHPWRKRAPELFEQLNRGKTSVVLKDESEETGNENKIKLWAKQILKILEDSRAQVLVTSWPLAELESLGLDYDTLKVKFPHLVYSVITPWGLLGDQDKRGDVGAFWIGSGLGQLMAGRGPVLPAEQPQYLGDLMGSFSVIAGTTAALYHAQRTGQGQLVDTCLLRTGLFANQVMVAVVGRDPGKLTVMMQPEALMRARYPVPTASSFKTKDGMWIQMLGIELPRHLPTFVSGLGLTWSVYPWLLPAVIKILLDRNPNKVARYFPLFELLNGAFEGAISKLTWDECQKLFREKGIWHVPVLPPKHALRLRQAKLTDSFETTVKDNGRHMIFIRAPTRLSSLHPPIPCSTVPALATQAKL